jgi:hypothetical protein
MKAKRSQRKDGRRPRLIETCHFISFFTKMKTAMRNTLYFSASEPGTFFDSAAQEKPQFYPLNYGNSDICDPFDSLCSLRTSF